ncbi:hypothetical protein CDD83_3999 [Cordyceps sp. RAO-2017]|nr:hypothetical protein CDD83_3999 [Cordyceps sp. RAO-2017]
MERLDTILQAHVAHGQDTTDSLLGAAFVVVDKNGPLYTGAAGRIDFDVAAKAFAGDSFTWVASLTKLLTTTCLMQLVERGLADLDSDVRDLVPELGRLQILRGFDADDMPMLDDNVDPVTLRMLLTHTVGLAYDLAEPDLIKWSAKVGRTAINLDWSRQGFTTPLMFAPGHGWLYGTSLDWAGLVLEQLTGQRLSQYMQAHIFDPLDMKDTGFWPEQLPHTASRTVPSAHRDTRTRRLEPVKPPMPREHEMESGGAGLFTTANDYARFLCALLGGRLVGEATVQEMFAPQLSEKQAAMLQATERQRGRQAAFAPEFPPGLRLDHGLGGLLNMEEAPGKRRKGSLLWMGMCNSRWWMDREAGIAAVMMVNVLDFGDATVVSLYDELVTAVYAHLVAPS